MDNNAVVEALNQLEALKIALVATGNAVAAKHLTAGLATLKQSLAQPAQYPKKPTDISRRLLQYASNPGYSHNDYADTMRAAAEEIQRYYGGMLVWKATAEAKDAAVSQPSAPVVPGDVLARGWLHRFEDGDYEIHDEGNFKEEPNCPGCVEVAIVRRNWFKNAPTEPQRDERAELLARAERAEGLIERIKDFAEIHNIYNLENEFSGAWDGLLQNVCPADLSKLTIRSEK